MAEEGNSVDDLAFAQPCLDWSSKKSFGWTIDPNESVDRNLMDLAYRFCRHSVCSGGHMGCVLASGIRVGGGGEPAHIIEHIEHHCRASLSKSREGIPKVTILTRTTNTPLLLPFRSDCHSEINAVADCARRGVMMEGASAYVTRAPCTACFQLLVMAGVTRIICPGLPVSPSVSRCIKRTGIEWVTLRENKLIIKERDVEARKYEDWGRVEAVREGKRREKMKRREEKRMRKEEMDTEALGGDDGEGYEKQEYGQVHHNERGGEQRQEEGVCGAKMRDKY